MELTVAELFAGVGGFRVGLNHVSEIGLDGKAIEKGDWQFVWANQWEPSTKVQNAFYCYTTRFGTKNHVNEDINTIDKITIPDHNLLVGGFPCQDYSVARSLSNEKGIEGKKGVLFWAIRDVIEAKHPSFILLENVDRLLKSPAKQRGRDFAIMLYTFATLGYTVEWRVINAADYGMPQKRKRIFLFAYKNKTKYGEKVNTLIRKDFTDWLRQVSLFNTTFPIGTFTAPTLLDLKKYQDIVAISSLYAEGNFLNTGIMSNYQVFQTDTTPKKRDLMSLGCIIEKANQYNEAIDLETYRISENKISQWKYLKSKKKLERIKPNGDVYYYSEGAMQFPDSLVLPARTMLTSEGILSRTSHVIYDDTLKGYRTLTEVEAELLQMFPPNWTEGMSRRKRYFMMGNALVTGIISTLEPVLKKLLANE